MDKFEHYIRDKFQSYTEQPSPQLWNNIQARLKPWYAKPLGKLAIATVVTVAVIGSIALIFTGKNKTKEYKALKIKTEIELKNITRTPYSGKNVREQAIALRPAEKPQPRQEKPKVKNEVPFHFDPVIKAEPEDFPQDWEFEEEDGQPVKFDIKFKVYPTQGCEPLEVSFDAEPPKGMEITWFIDKQKVSEEKSFTRTFNAGIHYIQLVIYDSNQTIIIYDTVEVGPHPVAQFEAQQCEVGKPLKVKNLSQNADCYVWIYSDGTTEKADTPHHVYDKAGLYRLKLVAKNKYCSDTAVDLIVVNKRNEPIRFPNAFVPSLSGPNGGYYNPNKPERSVFHPVTSKQVVEYSLRIYDRRGKLLFETNDINRGWDGYYRGQLVPVGVYIYIAEGMFDDGETFVKKGDVTVIYKQ